MWRLADQWITFNEPIVPVEFGYLLCPLPSCVMPKRQLRLPIIQLASTLVQLRLVMKSYQALRLGLSSTWHQPIHVANDPMVDVKAARIADLPAQSFLDPSVLGRPSRRVSGNFVWAWLCANRIHSRRGWNSFVENTVDFLGANWPSAFGVSWRHVLLSILTAHSCQSISMNLTWCQVARLTTPRLGNLRARNLWHCPKHQRKKLWQYWVDTENGWCWRWR